MAIEALTVNTSYADEIMNNKPIKLNNFYSNGKRVEGFKSGVLTIEKDKKDKLELQHAMRTIDELEKSRRELRIEGENRMSNQSRLDTFSMCGLPSSLLGGGMRTFTPTSPTPTSPPEIKPERIIYNNPATVVLWNDQTKTVVKTMEGDTFDKTYGFAMAYMKKMFGSSAKVKKMIKKCEVPVVEKVAKVKAIEVDITKKVNFGEETFSEEINRLGKEADKKKKEAYIEAVKKLKREHGIPIVKAKSYIRDDIL